MSRIGAVSLTKGALLLHTYKNIKWIGLFSDVASSVLLQQSLKKKIHWLDVTIKATVVVKGNLQAADTVNAN